jgi:hypothetical protein
LGEVAYYPIIDMTAIAVKFSNEARAWVAVNEESSPTRVLDVFMVKSVVTRIKVESYLKMYKPKSEAPQHPKTNTLRVPQCPSQLPCEEKEFMVEAARVNNQKPTTKSALRVPQCPSHLL